MSKRLSAVLFAVFLLLAEVYAQIPAEAPLPTVNYNSRVAGDTAIGLNALLHVPLFNLDVSENSTEFIRKTGLTFGLGIEGSISYFLTEEFYLGGGLSLRGIDGEAKQPLWMFDLDALAGFELPIYTSASGLNPLFVVPLTLRLSMVINRYTTVTTVNPALRPSAGFFLVLPDAPNWVIGPTLDYWWMFDLPGGADNRIANYLQIGIGFRYYTY